MSNFDQIGFPVEDEEQFSALGLQYAEFATEYETKLGSYLCWQEDEDFGPELWIQASGDEMIGMHPFFHGKSEMEVGVMAVLEEAKITPLDAPLFTWIALENDDPESGQTQCLFDIVNYYAHDVVLPKVQKLQVAAFPQDIEIYKNEAEFEQAHPGIIDEDIEDEDFNIFNSIGLGSFISLGLFNEEGVPPEPIALFAGKVLETKEIKNSSSGVKYQWALVEIMGGTVDVVIADEMRDDVPVTVGSIIKGVFWMGAKFKV